MRKSTRRPPPINRESAEAIALQGLTFLASDPARMLHFLKLTGLQPDEVRSQVGSAELSLAVLEHLAGDESLLLVFAASHDVAPESVSRAVAVLEGREP